MLMQKDGLVFFQWIVKASVAHQCLFELCFALKSLVVIHRESDNHQGVTEDSTDPEVTGRLERFFHRVAE